MLLWEPIRMMMTDDDDAGLAALPRGCFFDVAMFV